MQLGLLVFGVKNALNVVLDVQVHVLSAVGQFLVFIWVQLELNLIVDRIVSLAFDMLFVVRN